MAKIYFARIEVTEGNLVLYCRPSDKTSYLHTLYVCRYKVLSEGRRYVRFTSFHPNLCSYDVIYISFAGTQRVISFLRQMVEHGGFYRTSDQTWVKFERIQFVGACNPPTDPGRKPLSHRFLRHVPVVYVDYPGKTSLTQIYGTFNRAMLRLVPGLRMYAEPLTSAMVELYLMSQVRSHIFGSAVMYFYM